MFPDSICFTNCYVVPQPEKFMFIIVDLGLKPFFLFTFWVLEQKKNKLLWLYNYEFNKVAKFHCHLQSWIQNWFIYLTGPSAWIGIKKKVKLHRDFSKLEGEEKNKKQRSKREKEKNPGPIISPPIKEETTFKIELKQLQWKLPLDY